MLFVEAKRMKEKIDSMADEGCVDQSDEMGVARSRDDGDEDDMTIGPPLPSGYGVKLEIE